MTGTDAHFRGTTYGPSGQAAHQGIINQKIIKTL